LGNPFSVSAIWPFTRAVPGTAQVLGFSYGTQRGEHHPIRYVETLRDEFDESGNEKTCAGIYRKIGLLEGLSLTFLEKENSVWPF